MRALAAVAVVLLLGASACGDDAQAPSSSSQAGESGEGGSSGASAGNTGGGGKASQAGASASGSPGAAGAEPSSGGNDGTAGAGEGEGGATTGEGGSAGAAVTVDIVADETKFLDYGTLRLGFAQAVDAATLTVQLSPPIPARLVATGTTQVDATVVDVTLAYYHLPLDYQVTVAGSLPDATPFEASAAIPGLDNGARAAFISLHSGNGAFSGWAGAPQNATALEIADGFCQSEADAAGLRGTFQAFISIYDSVDAGCRALGLSGTVANNCGQLSMPVDDAPFLRMDGAPVVEGATEIIAGGWDTPIGFHADGTLATPFYTWVGSTLGAKGFNNGDCTGWTVTTGNGLPAYQVGERLLEYEINRPCDNNANLLCLQTGGDFFGPSTLHHAGTKRAFVSKGHLWGTMSFDDKTGVAAADALCQSEASAESLPNAAAYRAYLGTADTDALCYILGQTGKVLDNCGLSELPNTNPWRRVDDYPVGTALELATGKLQSPLALAADGTLMTNERPRTGADLEGATTWNCSDWAGSAFYSISGHPSFATDHWMSHWTTDCDGEEASVYCFEN
jgi:hypothetical protein